MAPFTNYVRIRTPQPGDAPQEFESGSEVVEYIMDRLDGADLDLVASYVARARSADFQSMAMGGAPIATPADAYQFEGQNMPLWVVGLRFAEPISVGRASDLSGIGDSSSPYQDFGGTEVYYLVDNAGNVEGMGFLDGPSDDGTPHHSVGWYLEDIADLPTVPPPTPGATDTP
jgi:hypothetical protein